MYNRTIGALVVSALASGCGTESHEGSAGPNPEERRSGANALDIHLAALGTAVLLCKASVGPNDFSANALSELERRFETCPNRPEQLQEIDRLLGLQGVLRSEAAAYFVNAWNRYVGHGSGRECPRWELQGVTNAPQAGSLPNPAVPESFYHWRVAGPSDCNGDPACATARAVECASWLGQRFVVSTDPDTGSVTTDPSYWKDNTNYGGTVNPFAPPWVHGMATATGWPPGDIWGAPNRCGESCTYFASDMINIFTGKLYVVNCGGGWICATECRSGPPSELPCSL